MMDLDSPKYLLALGEFLAQFAGVELALNHTVWHFAKLDRDPRIAKAIFSALRADAGMNHLTRLIDARKLKGPRIIQLKFIIEQLSKIARTRNDIVHLGAFRIGDGPFKVTNYRFAHTRDRIRTTFVGPRILNKMTADLRDIFLRLTIIGRHIAPGYTYKQLREEYGSDELPTWQYKPRGRYTRPRKRRGKPPKQQRQPKPLPA